jgi:hypothetical protein
MPMPMAQALPQGSSREEQSQKSQQGFVVEVSFFWWVDGN